MKPKHLLSLFLCCLLLCGCGRENPEPTVPTVTETAPMDVLPQDLYLPGSPIEQETNGAVLAYPLPMDHPYGLRAVGNRILILSGGKKTTLTVLAGGSGTVAGRLELPFLLEAQDSSLRTDKEGISYFDPLRRETVVLDPSLNELQAVSAPLDMVGTPILSEDRSMLYYCTEGALRCWDLNSGIRRMIKEFSAPGQRLAGLHMDDQVAECRQVEEGRTMLLSAQDGRLLYTTDENLTFTTVGTHWYAALGTAQQQLLLFGDGDNAPTLLTPENLRRGTFLECLHGAVTVGRGTLSYYSLSTGTLTSRLSLPGNPLVEDTGEGWVYVLAEDVLYRWDVRSLPYENQDRYTGPYSDRNLTQCQARAEELSEKYGIRILIGQEAADAHPWDYNFQPEMLKSVTTEQLEMLDTWLTAYPKEMLEDTKSHFSDLTLCLVRDISGAPASGSIGTANGLQFFDGTHAYLALAAGPDSDHALYHELFHVMETRLLTESTAFDRWDTLNPKGFDYNYSYAVSQNTPEYTEGDSRSFIDVYSMSYPKEDRARIMEFAMTAGNEELFRAPTLQSKLTALCQGIREAYGLKKSPETYRWEQYLEKPMAYTK